MAHDDRSLRGVGGWLAFFVVTLGVLRPIGSVVNTAGSLYGDPATAAFFGDRWSLVQVVEWTLVAACVAAPVYLGWRMSVVYVWRSVQLTIVGPWAITPAFLLLDSVAISLIGDVALTATLPMTVTDLVRGLIYAGVWTAYLLRSERVANTYGRYPETDTLGTVFE